MTEDDLDRDDGASGEPSPPIGPWYRGTITRVFYGSESGTLTSTTTGRQYHFKYPYVEIVGPIPRVDGLREGMEVGFDLSWTSHGERVSVIRVFD